MFTENCKAIGQGVLKLSSGNQKSKTAEEKKEKKEKKEEKKKFIQKHKHPDFFKIRDANNTDNHTEDKRAKNVSSCIRCTGIFHR